MYFFIFCKTDLVLQKFDDGTYSIPNSDHCPIPLSEWQHLHNITPMEDGTEVKAVQIDDPEQIKLRTA